MELAEVQDKLRSAYNKTTQKVYENMAEAKAAVEGHKQIGEILLAREELKHAGNSKSLMTTLAKASKEYEDWIDRYNDLRLDFYQKKAVVDKLEIQIKVLQSLNKTYQVL